MRLQTALSRLHYQVCQNPAYSGTTDFLTLATKKFGIELTYVPAACKVEEYRKAIKKNTRVSFNTHSDLIWSDKLQNNF